jgi:hypothetical protein
VFIRNIFNLNLREGEKTMTLKGKIAKLKKNITKYKRKLKGAENKIAGIVSAWKVKNEAFLSRVEKITIRIQKGLRMNTQEVKKWTEANNKWLSQKEANRQKRDEAYAERRVIKDKIEKLNLALAKALERDRARTEVEDNIISQVFTFREGIVTAMEGMNNFLTANVYDRLIGPDGELRSQLTLDSSDGLRRVVAMVNSISRIDTALAAEALGQVNTFFERVHPQKEEMDELTATLYGLTQKILIEKVNFKVGPDLYRFLLLELEEEIFPELVAAQRLLKRSLRSEKTNKYIRLYKRNSRAEKFEALKLSA